MVNPEHQAKCHELIDSAAAFMKTECERLYNSGGIDVTEFSPDEYALAKILVTASCQKAVDLYYPHYKYRSDLKNLSFFK